MVIPISLIKYGLQQNVYCNIYFLFVILIGAFLLPYLISLFLCGIPLVALELSLGQYFRQGPTTVFYKICPLLGGINTRAFFDCTIVARKRILLDPNHFNMSFNIFSFSTNLRNRLCHVDISFSFHDKLCGDIRLGAILFDS